MSALTNCPKCGGGLRTEQIEYRKRLYCDHCGGMPYRDGKPETGRGHVCSGEPRGPTPEFLASVYGASVSS